MAELRVLVADDDANMLDLMSRRLGRMGLQVDRAQDGRTALEMLKRASYGLILTDIYMPGATGLDIIRLAKENDPHVQVVLVTGSATLDNAVEALNMGAFSHLTKPFDHLSVFDNAVSRALEFRRLSRDDLRMAEIQRRRGDLLGDEVTERVRLLRTRQQELKDLRAWIPDGVVILEEGGVRRRLDPAGLCGSVDGVRPWRDHDPVRVLPGHYLHVRTGRAPEAPHRSADGASKHNRLLGWHRLPYAGRGAIGRLNGERAGVMSGVARFKWGTAPVESEGTRNVVGCRMV